MASTEATNQSVCPSKPTSTSTSTESASSPPAPLPKLSASEFRAYNRLAELMQAYHNHFRQTWTTLHTACTTRRRPQNMSIRQFLSLGDRFVSSLTMHHDIEEAYIFPNLARKMPAFRDQDAMKSQHRAIHKGLDEFEKYLSDCRSGEKELRLEELQKVMNSFGDVLWQHLDDEVAQLGAENMRKYWTKEEMINMPF